jgi:hypothetical protein
MAYQLFSLQTFLNFVIQNKKNHAKKITIQFNEAFGADLVPFK